MDYLTGNEPYGFRYVCTFSRASRTDLIVSSPILDIEDDCIMKSMTSAIYYMSVEKQAIEPFLDIQ